MVADLADGQLTHVEDSFFAQSDGESLPFLGDEPSEIIGGVLRVLASLPLCHFHTLSLQEVGLKDDEHPGFHKDLHVELMLSLRIHVEAALIQVPNAGLSLLLLGQRSLHFLDETLLDNLLIAGGQSDNLLNELLA